MAGKALCPDCETGELRPNPFLVRCSGCGYALSRELFVTLCQIRALPEAWAAPRERETRGRRPDETRG